MQHRCNIDKIGLATVVHIPCELSKFVFFSLQDGTVSGTIVDTKHKVSSIPEGGLEILCLLNFTHPCKEILDRMKEFVKKQSQDVKSPSNSIILVAVATMRKKF